VGIPFSVWSQAAPADRIDLLADNLIESIGRIPIKHLTANDRQILANAVNDARCSIKARTLN
jgi:hypothetical protein